MAQCTCNVGPGKFEGEPAAVYMAYQQMCLGNADTEIGRYVFFKKPFLFDADQSVIKDALAYGYCQECIDNHGDAADYGLVIWERDDGFVMSERIETEAEWNKAIEQAEEEDSEASEEDNCG